MRRLIMWNLLTLDGYFEGETNWDLSFHDLVWGEELERLSVEQLQSADMLVFGRITYQGMASYWKNATGEIADRMNSIPKVVFSSTLDTVDWSNTSLARDPAVDIPILKQGGDRNIFVFGSGILCADLIRRNLFDEYRLAIVPVYLGKGRRLFDAESNYQRLVLLEARPLSTGCVILRYAPATERL